MDEAAKEHLRNHWITRAMRRTREIYLATNHADPLFLIIDAACMAAPLFGDEPYFVRPTPQRVVGGVIRFRPGTKDKALYTVVMIPQLRQARRIEVCDVTVLIDGLGTLINEIGCDSREAIELLDKVRKWITHDDTLDDVPDKVSWAQRTAAQRTLAANSAPAQASASETAGSADGEEIAAS
jgi:hypothetical protein